MNTLVFEYLASTLNTDIKPRCKGKFYEIYLFNEPILVIFEHNKKKLSAKSKKHVHVWSKMTSCDRARLINYKIPFIIPGKHIYLPMFGIDLREYFRKMTVEYTPAAQVLAICVLLGQQGDDFTQRGMAKRLGYSIMSMSRAFRCNLKLDSMRSPVKRRVNIDVDVDVGIGVCAGLTALAHYTNLAEPNNKTVAMSSVQWATIKDVEWAGETEIEIEIWSYDPSLFAKDGIVDPISLYLSLKDVKDERVEAELETLLRRSKR